MKIHFNDNGSHDFRTVSGTKIASYSKKSPSRMRRDEDRSTNRRVTRSQVMKVRDKEDTEIEHPRTE